MSKVIKEDQNALVFRQAKHSGPVKGLHFNPTLTHQLASGATDGEVNINSNFRFFIPKLIIGKLYM